MYTDAVHYSLTWPKVLFLMLSRGSRFLNYNFLQFAVDGKNNSKTKVEKAFFFIFMSSYAEMRFLKQKITKRVEKFFFWK
jgi:hypothetical protein